MLRTCMQSSPMRRRVLQQACAFPTARQPKPVFVNCSYSRTLGTVATANKGIGSCFSIIPKQLPQKQQQYRSYIFLPSSFSELFQNLQRAWNSQQEKRIVLVKLLKDKKKRNDRIKVSLLKKKNRMLLYLYNKKKKQRRRQLLLKQGQLLKKSAKWRVAAANRFVSFKERVVRGVQVNRESLWRYQRRLQLGKHKLHSRLVSEFRPLLLEEYSKADWFDENGYPQTSRDVTGRFVNPWSSQSTNGHHSLGLFLKWRWERFWNKKPSSNGNKLAIQPQVVNNYGKQQEPSLSNINHSTILLQHNKKDTIQLQWIGHSTCFVRMSGVSILTDPHFSQYASPIQKGWGAIAPRAVPPAVDVACLPDINLVCISHDHYDHLDFQSICFLKDKVQWWVVPLGFKEWLQVECNVCPDNIVEMQWWESAKFTKTTNGEEVQLELLQQQDNGHANKKQEILEVTCAPAQHWCSRTPWDRNVRLWCSWAMSLSSHQDLKFYFAGDSGYPTRFPLFQQIGDVLGPFDLSAIPIGAYAPRWFMADSHASPQEALKMHVDLRSKKSVAIHWGTFELADEALEEPPKLLREAIENEKDDIDFVVLRHGETVESSPREQELMTAKNDREADLSDADLYNDDDDDKRSVGLG